jgi:signal transduction histidine kinase
VTLTWRSFGEALLWSIVAGVVVWLALTPVRRRSLAGLLASLVLVGAAASAGAVWGAVHAMLVSWNDWKTMAALTAFSGLVTAVAAFAVGRRLASDNRSLQRAVAELGQGLVPATDGPPLTAEVERVRNELRTTAAALTATRQREQALEAARRELVAWVSHDLRTPLAGLRAMAEALEDGVVEDPEQYYKQIISSVHRLNGMVEDLFALSRIQAGELSHAADRVELSGLVSDCLMELRPLADAHRVELLQRTEGAGSSVLGSAPELHRALTNLVANAIRHTRDDGQVEVVLEAGGGQGTDAAPAIAVRDECGGIAQEHIGRLFDVGFRGEAARTPLNGLDPPGAGLGLAITRGIVEAHGGSIDVRNTAVGCEFRIQLRRAMPPADGS